MPPKTLLTLLTITNLAILSNCEDAEAETFEIAAESYGLDCGYVLEVVDKESNFLELELSNDCGPLKHSSVTMSEIAEGCQLFGFFSCEDTVVLIRSSLEEDDSEAVVTVTEGYGDDGDEVLLEISFLVMNILPKTLDFVFTPMEISQHDLIESIMALNKQLKENELFAAKHEKDIAEMKSFKPVSFKEVLTDNRQRDDGWQTINLDYVSDSDDSFIGLNPSEGCIVLQPGVYSIQARVNFHITGASLIRITSGADEIPSFQGLNGSPTFAGTTSGMSDTASVIPTTVVEIDQAVSLYLRIHVTNTRYNGAMFDADFPHDESAHVASVTVQRLSELVNN